MNRLEQYYQMMADILGEKDVIYIDPKTEYRLLGAELEDMMDKPTADIEN